MAKVIEPNTLTLTACSIAESDAVDGPAWDEAATYAKDAPVRYNHVRYQSLAASNVGKDPSVEANNSGQAAVWRKLGATGPYKMLDDFVETQTVGTEGTPLTFTVPFDHANSFALFNLSADSTALTGTAAQLTGKTVTDNANTTSVTITNLESTTTAQLQNIAGDTVSATWNGTAAFTGNLGSAAVNILFCFFISI